MQLRSELPHVRAYEKGDTFYMLPEEAHAEFKAAWMAGRAFWEGLDLWGAEVTIKLGVIASVSRRDAAVMALYAEEDQEHKRRELLNSDDGPVYG